jgi:hypothetical protein
LTSSIEDCDYVFLDFRHHKEISNLIDYLDKTVMIDFRDNPNDVFKEKFMLYFKRSVVNKRSLTFINYNKKIIPISYSLKSYFFTDDKIVNLSFDDKREIDVAVLFSPYDKKQLPENDEHNIVEPQAYRRNLARFIDDNFDKKKYKIHVGRIGNWKRGKGHDTVVDDYVNVLLKSKIVITSDPDRWEGDYRFFEALGCGPLVFTNKMITPVVNPFVDGTHLIYYDRLNLNNNLKSKIVYYLENDDERKMIAKCGYEHAMKYHKCTDRIDEVLSYLPKKM